MPMAIVLKLSVIVVLCLICLVIVRFGFGRAIKNTKNLNIKFFKSVIEVIILLIGIYNCLSCFDTTKEISKTLLQSSALILAIATFAAQQALSNVISGFVLTFTKPYEINDKIKVMDGSTVIAEGIVADITIRHTIIKTFDGQSSIIPNNKMDNAVILNTNFTKNVGNFIEIEIGYDSDIEKAIKLFKSIVVRHSKTINEDDNTKVTVSRFTANGMILKSTIWTTNLDDNFMACSDIRKTLVESFNANHITIPYNTVTISK